MSHDKKRSTSSDMEYQYADESSGQESLQEPSKKSSPLRMLREKIAQRLPKSRKSRVLFTLITGVYLAYTFLNFGGGEKGKEVPYKPRLAQENGVDQSTSSKPALPVEPVKPPVAIQVEPLSAPPVIETPPQTSDFKPTTSAPAVSLLESSALKEMTAKIAQLNHTTTELQSSLLNLTGSAVRLSEKVTRLEKINQRQKKENEINPLPIFYVRSLASGRAWIYSSIGDTMTVKVGDFIPGYGQVKKIDFYKGMIWTTSDRQIQYGVNDN
jgi:hypothetical protein